MPSNKDTVEKPLLFRLQRWLATSTERVRGSILGQIGAVVGLLRTPWSIKRVVKREMAEWAEFNSFRKAHSYSNPEKANLYLASRPIRFSLVLLVLYAAALFTAENLPMGIYNGHFENWGNSDYLSYFTSLWSIQATIAAVIYPLVISFVAVFLQRRPSAEAFVNLYLIESGAISSGLSCLMLVVLMSVEYFLIPSYGIVSLRKAVYLDSAWFVLNACMTTYFLVRTMQFLKPEVQAEVVMKYAANVALPETVERMDAQAVLMQARTKGWLPPEADSTVEDSDVPKVVFSRYFSHGIAQGKLKSDKIRRLVNVRLWLLRVVMLSWMGHAHKHVRPAKAPGRRRSYAPTLTLNISPGAEYGKDAPIGWVTDGPDLRAWHLLALRWALSFSDVSGEYTGIQLSSLLSEFEADARTAAANADVESFRVAYNRVIDIHQLLLGCSLAMADDGEVGSWAEMTASPQLFGLPLHIEWANVHRTIYQAAIGAIALDLGPIRRVCHTVQYLDSDELSQSPLEIRVKTLQLPSLLMYLIGNWWIQQVEEQGIVEHGHHQMVSLRAPLHRTYEAILMEFVSGWENARTHLAPLSDDSETFTWKLAKEIAAINTQHVQDTGRLLLEAVARGDLAAASWFADVLAKWWSGLDFHNPPFELYGKTDFLTVEHLNLEWDEVAILLKIQVETNALSGQTAALQRGVLLAAVENVWTDIRILVIEQLLAWSIADTSKNLKNSLAIDIACGLITGRRWKPGGDVHRPLNSMSPSDYLIAKVRQYCSGQFGSSSYVGRLNQFVSRIKDMDRPNMIGSRVYSFSGADDVGSLRDLQVLYLALLSETEWHANETVRTEVAVWVPHDVGRIDTLSYQINSWIERIEPVKQESTHLLSELIERCDKNKSIEEKFGFAKSALDEFSTFIATTKNNAIESAQIQPERLRQIGEFASAMGFKKSTGAFPLHLFESITYLPAEFQNFTLTMNQYRKAELTDLEAQSRSSGEERHWSTLMAERVGAVVLGDVLRASLRREIVVPTPESYWKALKTEASRISSTGDVPVLLLDNATRPSWVWEWQHHSYSGTHTRPDDLHVQRFDGHGDAYLCSFNNILVYGAHMQPGQSILLSKQSFGELRFTEFEEKVFVRATTRERADSTLLVDLQLTFSRRLGSQDREAVVLTYRTSDQQSNGDAELME